VVYCFRLVFAGRDCISLRSDEKVGVFCEIMTVDVTCLSGGSFSDSRRRVTAAAAAAAGVPIRRHGNGSFSGSYSCIRQTSVVARVLCIVLEQFARAARPPTARPPTVTACVSKGS